MNSYYVRTTVLLLSYRLFVTTAMPKSYSTDLRWRVIWLHVFLGKSIDEVAALLFISSRTVHRYVAKFVNTGDVAPQVHRNGPLQGC